MAKEGYRVAASNKGTVRLDPDGKIKLTNTQGLCGECCRTNEPCQLSVAGFPGRNIYGVGHPVYPITINNLPWLDHTDGYGQNCDEMFRLMVDPDGPWDYTERDMALTSLKLECNDDETTTVTSELIRFDLLDESPSRWREMNRRTDVGAWPLYKMTPTLNEATFEMTVDIGWRRDSTETDDIIFTTTAPATADLQYSGDGAVKAGSVSTTSITIENIEEGGTGTITFTIDPQWLMTGGGFGGAATNFSLQLRMTGKNAGISSVFQKIRSFMIYASDSATVSYTGDGNCLLCSNYEIVEISFGLGGCNRTYQIAATENVRPWLWAGVQFYNLESLAVDSYNDGITQNPDEWDLSGLSQNQTFAGQVDCGPGWPISTHMRGPKQEALGNDRFPFQEVWYYETGNGLEIWTLRSPRGHKGDFTGRPFQRSYLADHRWHQTGLPPQQAKLNTLNYLNNGWRSYPANFVQFADSGATRATVKHPSIWADSTHPAHGSRTQTNSATIALIRPNPMPLEGQYESYVEANAQVQFGGISLHCYGYVFGGTEVYSLVYLVFYAQQFRTVITRQAYEQADVFGTYAIDATAEIPDIRNVASGTHYDQIEWNVNVNGQPIVSGKLADHPGGIPFDFTHPFMQGDTYASDNFRGYNYIEGQAADDFNRLGLSGTDSQSVVSARAVRYYFEGGGIRDAGSIYAENPEPPGLQQYLNKPTKLAEIKNVKLKITY
jgi:hypothetical protein